MGDAIITRRAGGASSSNQLIALWWGYWGPEKSTIYSDSAYAVVYPFDSNYFSYDAGTGYLTALKTMDVNIMPIVRGSRNGSGTAKNITYNIYVNGSSVASQSGITVSASTLTSTATSVSLTAGNIINMSVVANITGTASIEAGFFIELQ